MHAMLCLILSLVFRLAISRCWTDRPKEPQMQHRQQISALGILFACSTLHWALHSTHVFGLQEHVVPAGCNVSGFQHDKREHDSSASKAKPVCRIMQQEHELHQQHQQPLALNIPQLIKSRLHLAVQLRASLGLGTCEPPGSQVSCCWCAFVR